MTQTSPSRMRRGLVLTVLMVVGLLSVAIAESQAPPQGLSPQAVAAAQIEKVKENLYIITGSGVANRDLFSGGNTAVFITENGVVIVDTKLPGWGQVILDRVRTVTDKPITTIINTHTHADHTGSNEFFGTAIETVVHENTRANMAKMDAFKGEKSKFLPKRTYKDKLSLFGGKDRIDLYYFGPGHTDGDAFVVFPALRVMHTGDMFAWKDLPFIDVNNGGRAVALPQTLARTHAALAKDVDIVINGHIPLSSPKDLLEYADFNRDFLTWAEGQMKAGKSIDEATAAYTTPARYKGYGQPQAMRLRANIEAVYKERGKN